MIAVLLPLADHGNAVSALPFVAPMVLVVAGLLFLVARDRLASRADRDADREDAKSSTV